METSAEHKKLTSKFNKLNKQYLALDKANEKETNESVLLANYDKMDAITNEMGIIANRFEEISEEWKTINQHPFLQMSHKKD